MKKIYILITVNFALGLGGHIGAFDLRANSVILYYSYDKTFPLDYVSSLITEDVFSIRIKSMDRNLAGIVSDTIADMFWNPARLPLKSFISYRIPNRLITSFPGPFGSRGGILLEGSYNTSESEYIYPVPSDSYIYTDYLRNRSYSYSRNTYNGALLGAKQITPNTSIGFRFDYLLQPYNNNRNDVLRYTRERVPDNNYKYLYVRENVDEYTMGDTLSSCSFSIGTVSSIWNSDIEIVLGFANNKTAGSIQDTLADIYHDERTYTSDNDSVIAIDIYNGEEKQMLDQYDFFNPKFWTLGFRFSKGVTPTSTFRTVATIYRGAGDSERRREDRDYYCRDNYYSYTNPDTSYFRSDTSEAENGVEYILEGDTRVLGGFLSSGQEFNFSPKISLGVGIKVSYEKSEIRLEGTKYETEDTLTSQSFTDEVGIERKAYIYFPLGMEYKPIPEIALRAGFRIHGSYEFSEDKTNGKTFRSKYLNGPSYDINIGAGLNWERFNFDIYTQNISAIESWDIEGCYNF